MNEATGFVARYCRKHKKLEHVSGFDELTDASCSANKKRMRKDKREERAWDKRYPDLKGLKMKQLKELASSGGIDVKGKSKQQLRGLLLKACILVSGSSLDLAPAPPAKKAKLSVCPV